MITARSLRRSSLVALAAATLFATTIQIAAHRRDEILQAARIGIDPGAVQLQLDLTPGIALADAVAGDIDRDADGAFSGAEQHAYAAAVVKALDLAVDGHAAQLRLERAAFPSLDAMRRGEGTIALQVAAALSPVPAGAHRLTFRNNHHPAGAAYLANALVPESARVSVTGQLRDTEQRMLSVDYVLRPAAVAMSISTGWIAGGLALAVAASLILLRTLRTSIPSGVDRHRDAAAN